ncbi:DUF6607 family protein [Wenzhouxiangella marina]|uniref:Uncharacterized protein n=1 Tax=Wenzhouxiangella marina TaxID=1579979 RepID=A0A0K0XXE3_9GAMM|nr:DUF6607 family protein [Wenzhouxiangella marina]AKS42353.1 hypothetical protein WM2015_1987 [Wenzhouxiangella marina]MBB6085874.1 hypothetical protein [Wenzhouxiangella marina]
MKNLLLILPASALLAACASTPPTPLNDSMLHSLPPAADREAILAMAGEYTVTFAFDETVALQPDYQRKPPKRSGAAEAVIVVENEPDRIVLQHLLLVGSDEGARVVKHWRQDWVWEAEQRLEFLDDQTWRMVMLDPEQTRGAWTQCVYEVSDAPRYCGTGRWNHRYGNPTWTSDRSWRPLPRREYTTRDDYTALNVENRHTITPEGWTHEQDNSKVLRVDGQSQGVLVREFGFNNYLVTEEVDFTPVYEYWNETREYWAKVRAAWQSRFDAGGVVLDTEVDGMPIIEGLFELADQARSDRMPSQADIDAVFEAWVRPLARPLANR